jgi:hypothetical protein
MDKDALVNIFLFVIALGILLQAGLVAALAVGARILTGKMADLEDAVEREVLPRLDSLAEMAGRMADASEDALAEAERISTSVARSATRFSASLGAVAERVADAAEGTAGRIENALDAGERVAKGPVRRSRALFRGVRRALDVWRHGTEPARDY